VLVDGHPVTPRASFGVQVLPGPDGALDTATVLARVDDAMYQQKRARREAERRAAMAAIRLVDPPPDAPTSALVRMAADVCDAESAAVSLADGDRQVFTTRSEFPVDSAPAELTLCRRVVLSDAPLVVPDSREEAALADNPYFGGADGLRFYAGVPLRASGGHTIGALCVVDRSPHTLSEHHVTALQYLADRIVLTLGGEDAG
jgi:GAF domain-containing protein